MSVQAVRDFWQKTRQDPALGARFQAIKPDDKDSALTAVISLAATAGFVFTAKEYESAVKEELARQHRAGEITDEELARVAGGSRAIRRPEG